MPDVSPLFDESAVLLDAVLANGPIGLGFLDPDLRFLRANETLARGNGIPVDAHLGLRIDEVWPSIPRELLCRLEQCLVTGEAITDVEISSDGPGPARTVIGSYYPVGVREIAGIGVVVVDITERKLAEEALLASEERLRDMLENVKLIAVIVDGESRILYCNPYLAELTGWTREELLGREWYETFTPYAVGERRDIFLRHIVEGTVNPHAEGPIWTRSGELRLISWSNTVVRDRSGRGVAATSIGADITDRRRAEEDMRALAEQQGALRRVATLAAAEAPAEEIFAAVAEEAARVVAAQAASVFRYESATTARVVGRWGGPELTGFPTGTVLTLDGDSVLGRVRSTGAPARIDDYSEASGELAAAMLTLGFRSVAAAPVFVGGDLWGALSVGTGRIEPLPPDTHRRLREFAEIVGLALASAEARAELARSRVRIVEAADTARRRIERDLHDGAQQRLVSTALTLSLAERRLADHPEAAELVAAAHRELDHALAELRELARGIHPAVLTDQGLRPALAALVARCPFVVEVEGTLARRYPQAVEIAAYYAVSESLANATKHAHASSGRIRVGERAGRLVVEVADDGRGGAVLDGGSGLRGLSDRVQALGGTLWLESPPGAGTVVRIELPASLA
jgi:PAS domain S-box-containing protein